MLRLGMLVGCIFAMSRAMKQQEQNGAEQDLNSGNDASYSVTCYMCVNVSDNLVCNQYAIDRPCTAGEIPTYIHLTEWTPVQINKYLVLLHTEIPLSYMYCRDCYLCTITSLRFINNNGMSLSLLLSCLHIFELLVYSFSYTI